MYPIRPSYYNDNDADGKASHFNQTMSLPSTQTTTLLASPSSPPGTATPVSVNSSSSPLSNIYVPNMPIQESRSEYYSNCIDWGNMRTNNGEYHYYSPKMPYSSYYPSNYNQWNLWDNNRTFDNFTQRVQSNRYADLPIYQNRNYANTYSQMGPFPFNCTNFNNPMLQQAPVPSSKNFIPQKNLVYSQANQRYQHFLVNECHSYPRPRQNNRPVNSTVTVANFHCNPRVYKPRRKKSASQPPVVSSPLIVVDKDEHTERNHKHGIMENTPVSGTKNESDVGNFVIPKKHELLVSLPGGIPLFSVPLNTTTKKRRGRPPKPKPPPKDPQPTKPRRRRGKSQLKLLQNAPNTLPCVSTLEAFQNLQSNATIVEPQPCSSSSIKVNGTASDLKIIGSFPCGTSSLEKSSPERKKVRTSEGFHGGTYLSNTTMINDASNSAARCFKNITHNNLILCNAENGKTTLQKNDYSYGNSLISINLERDNGPENCIQKRKYVKAVSKGSQKTTSKEEVKLPKKRGRKKKEDFNSNKGSLELHYSTVQETKTPKSTVSAQKHENQAPITTSNVLNEYKIKTDTATTFSSKESKCLLNMPDIFDLLQESNSNGSDQKTKEEPAQTENLLELEEMMNLHASDEASAINNAYSHSTLEDQNQVEMQKGFDSTLNTRSVQNYFPSFLSDDSNDANSTTSENNAQNDDLTTDASNPNPPVAGKQSSNDMLIQSHKNEGFSKSDCSLTIDIKSSSYQTFSSLSNSNTTWKKGVSPSDNLDQEMENDAANGSIHSNSNMSIFGSEKENNNISLVATTEMNTGEILSSTGHLSDPINMLSDLLSNIESPSNENLPNGKISTDPTSSFISLWEEFIHLMETESDQTSMMQEKVLENEKAAKKSYITLNQPNSYYNYHVEKTSAFVRVIPRTEQRVNTDKWKKEEGSGKQNKEFKDNIKNGGALDPLLLRKPPTPEIVTPVDLSMPAKKCRSTGNSVKFQQNFPNSFKHSSRDLIHPSLHYSKMVEQKREIYSANEKSKTIARTISKGADDDGVVGVRKIEYDQMGNRVVKRMAHRTHVPQELIPKRKYFVRAFERSIMKRRARKGVKQIQSRAMPRSRTNTMINNLIKFSNRQNGKSAVNETKSKLNAELDKVFLLGNNPCKRKFPVVENLKEVQLEILGPMERRPKLRKKLLEKGKKDDKPNKDSVKKINEIEKAFPSIHKLEPHQPIENWKTFTSLLEVKENCQLCLSNSTCSCSRDIQSQHNENQTKENSSQKVDFIENNLVEEDEDVLDIHAERDSALDMFF